MGAPIDHARCFLSIAVSDGPRVIYQRSSTQGQCRKYPIMPSSPNALALPLPVQATGTPTTASKWSTSTRLPLIFDLTSVLRAVGRLKGATPTSTVLAGSSTDRDDDEHERDASPGSPPVPLDAPSAPLHLPQAPAPARRRGNDRLPVTTVDHTTRPSFGQILDEAAALHIPRVRSPSPASPIELVSRSASSPSPSPSPPPPSTPPPPNTTSPPTHPWVASAPTTPARFHRTPHITAALRLHRSRTSFADVSAHVTQISEWGRAGGGYCDVHTGVLDGVGLVALKKLRMHVGVDGGRAEKRFRHEADTWCRLDHRHVLPFFGLCDRGDLPHYLSERPDVDRLVLITQTADALHYLHANGIVHGDIKGNNVLISSTGDALLCDFGLAIVLSDLAVLSGNPSDLNGVGTGRYMAPELFALTGDHEGDGEGEGDVAKTMASDVFASGMLVAEIITGHVPMHHLRYDMAVLFAVAQGKRPHRPAAWRDTHEEVLWLLAERCWDADPKKRPASKDIYDFLRWYVPVSRGEEVDAETEPLLWAHIAPHVREKERVTPLPTTARHNSSSSTQTPRETEDRLRKTLMRDTQFVRLRRALVGLIVLDLAIALLAVVQLVITGLLYSSAPPALHDIWPLAFTASGWTVLTYAPLFAFQLIALVFLRGFRLSRLFTIRARLAYAIVACALLVADAGLFTSQRRHGDGKDMSADGVNLLVVHEALAWSLAALTGLDAGCQALRMWGVLLAVPSSTETALSRSYVLSA
ncbi:kinase-like protein [Schizophyllum commune Tattone D]|nr:kinase-like protein [Schizophyllum commune Tattone D]